jgi:hypothetical protein
MRHPAAPDGVLLSQAGEMEQSVWTVTPVLILSSPSLLVSMLALFLHFRRWRREKLSVYAALALDAPQEMYAHWDPETVSAVLGAPAQGRRDRRE